MSNAPLPELTHWESKTPNGGRTTIISSTADAVAMGQSFLDGHLDEIKELRCLGVKKLDVQTRRRDSDKVKRKAQSLNKYEESWLEWKKRYALAVSDITNGDPDAKHFISETAQKLMNLALEITPSIASAYCGFERWEDGDEVFMDLLREGDDRPFLRRKRSDIEPRPGCGDGAYRIILNTDVPWMGSPHMNASVMGAMVLILQQFGAVEIWIQQGWIGNGKDDGVSLFKLDFNGSFDATQLSFWCGSRYKDIPFSRFVNSAIGRVGTIGSKVPELPCDMFLKGDWMALHGISDEERVGFQFKPKHVQEQIAAEWIAKTCAGILYEQEALDAA